MNIQIDNHNMHALSRSCRASATSGRQIEISQHIEDDISAYLITITIMNAAVGIATALAMWLCGLGDPILWGAVAFLLNYIPILGSMIGVVMFTLAAVDFR